MARLLWRQKIVHEVQVPHERAIDECRPVNGCAAAADQRAWTALSSSRPHRHAPDSPGRLAGQGSDGATERIQNMQLEAFHDGRRQILERSLMREAGKLLDLKGTH